MERLTKRIGGNVYYTKGKYDETIPAECKPHDVRKILQALAAYENTNHTPEECATAFNELAAHRAAEQDGTLLRLPCKHGDTVWFTKSAFSLAIFPIEAKHVSIRGINRDGEIMYNCITSYNNIDRRFVSADIGKTVFLTREAADAALKEQEGQE